MFFCRPFILAILAAGVAWSAGDAVAGAYKYSVNSSGPSKYAGVRKELAAAGRDLAKATAAAVQNGDGSDAVKQAAADLGKARKTYNEAMAAARRGLASDPLVGPLQKRVADAEGRLREQTDARVRMVIVADLAEARGELNAAEWNAMGVDPDLAMNKAAVEDAAKALRDAQSQHQSRIQQDPAVTAAKQRILALRQQMRGR